MLGLSEEFGIARVIQTCHTDTFCSEYDSEYHRTIEYYRIFTFFLFPSYEICERGTTGVLLPAVGSSSVTTCIRIA